MDQGLRNLKVLIVNDAPSSQKMLASMLRLQGISAIETAYEASDGYRYFKRDNHNIIIAELLNGKSDGIALARQIRTAHDSPNPQAPVLAIGGKNSLHLVDAAAEAGVSDLLMAPYSVDDVVKRIRFLAGADPQALQAGNAEYRRLLESKAQIAPHPPKEETWPADEDAMSLTQMLLEHYLKHHEIVLMKLKFAQQATRKSIEEIRTVHQKVKGADSAAMKQFKDFDAMWEDIVGMFVRGGLSADDIFRVEDLITKIPPDIEQHYTALSQQDKDFLKLVESLNRTAYQRAREKVAKIQAHPNPLNGRAAQDYAQPQQAAPEAAKETSDVAWKFVPPGRKSAE